MSRTSASFVIKPDLWNGLWVFDVPGVGLIKEPFGGGVPQMIERAARNIPNARQGFVAVLSAGYFPDAGVVLEWVPEEGGGNVYRWAETGQEGWLCPALFRYCEKAPTKLDVRAKPASAAG